MSLQIYNTLTREKQEFIPITKGKVKMYVCGVTVYDHCHLGHGRAYAAFDIVHRYLKYLGYEVIYVRNITDIDDKIIARANQIEDAKLSLKEKVSAITAKYIDEFHKDMESLNILPPVEEPRATEYIPQMIKIIEKLVNDGIAYIIGGDVYFNVERFKDYGKLSRRSTDELLAGARVEPDKRKKNPLDFSLWKEAKLNEPFWESPWGKGRPGWHIECSAMSLNILGEEFDVHGGGQDLIFPHHENEIAQSCGFTGKQPVHYWIHNGFVTINKEKMSKSLGNFFTLRDIFKKYDPNIVRYFLLSQHYRSPVDFSDQLLDDAKHSLERIEECLRKVRQHVEDKDDMETYNVYKNKFQQAMDDDFNTAQALAVIFDLVKDINNNIAQNQVDSKIIARTMVVKEMLSVLGIKYNLAETCSVNKSNATRLDDATLQKIFSEKLNDANILKFLLHRNYCRSNKEWAMADRIRKYIEEQGYILHDTAERTEWIERKQS